jgi:hypothetical protein
MSVNSPTLTTSISTGSGTAYVSEIDQNFSDLQIFCDAVETELNANPIDDSMFEDIVAMPTALTAFTDKAMPSGDGDTGRYACR